MSPSSRQVSPAFESRTTTIGLVLLLTVLLSAEFLAAASTEPRQDPTAAAQQAIRGTTAQEAAEMEEKGSGPTDPIELEAFTDGLMAAYLESFDTAGATVSVVRDGELMLAKGYGYADVAARKKVSAETTLFRIGSISKLFVWTSVMQLVEQGRLNLDADINTYLAHFQIPATYDEPVTLANLMSHTPGFEDRVIGLFGREEATIRPLEDILASELPSRVRPPGNVASYSNHGTGMAAYIVEQVSGLAWDDYVERNILEPMGMEQTTFRQPVPARLRDDVSKGYTTSRQVFDEQGFEYVPLAPVGAAGSSATDMAKFMIAHLHDGEYGGVRILEEGTARRMRGVLHRHAIEANPMSHGFIDMSRNEQWIIGHGGDTFWFHSMLALLPEHDLGFFVSFNSEDGGAGTSAFVEAFMDHYFPLENAPELAPPDDFAERAARYVGSYRVNRYAHTTLAKLGALEAVEITATDDGALQLSNTGRKRWIEVAPLTFRVEDGYDRIIFRDDESGNITHMFLAEVPIIGFDRLAGWESPGSQTGVFIFSLAMFAMTLVLWPTATVVRIRYRSPLPPEKRLPVGARFVGWIASLLTLAFVIGFAAAMDEPQEIVYGIPANVTTLLMLPIVVGALTLPALFYTVRIWMRDEGALWRRLYFNLLTLALVLSLAQAYYWNLLGYRY